QNTMLADERKRRPPCHAMCYVTLQQGAGQRPQCWAAGMLAGCTLQENMREESWA
ncbi:unnamed protein product, partial [Bubo scandiacus]